MSTATGQETEQSNPYLEKVGKSLRITPRGYAYLDNVLTDSKGDVYVFNNNIPPVMVAAAMARLSRRAGDMRLTILDEFAQAGEQDANALIQRVVTAYGDDSVQQLTGIHVVVEGASNLLTKMLERGRFMAALEQSTRYIYFDTRDEQGRYAYLRLNHLPDDLQQDYNATMDAIFDGYSGVVRQLSEYVRNKHPQGNENRITWMQTTRADACDAARPLLPVATRSTVGLFGSSQALEALIMRLLSEDLPEAQRVGQALLEQGRKIIPAFLERADDPKYGGATTAYRHTRRTEMRSLARKYLQRVSPQRRASVELVDYWPLDERDLVAEMLFEQSELGIAEIRSQIAAWPARRHHEVIGSYVGERLNRRHRPGRAAEKPHFEWEIVDDYGTFRDIQRHRVVDAMEWQTLSIDYGYEVPGLVKEAGLEKEFRRIFRLAEGLHRRLVAAGYDEEAQYATLFGHRMRYRFLTNLRQAFHLIELRTSPTGHPGYRRICQKMGKSLRKVYPSLGKAMKFVNQSESQELLRLAAERATQSKLERMGVVREEIEE
jgi:thymidylate synthase ThyX